MIRRIVVMICLGAGLSVGTAGAASSDLTRTSGPNTYFNRPGADLATHDRELRECLVLAAAAQQPQGAAVGGNMMSMILQEAIMNEMTKHLTSVAVTTNTENCMVVRGWRVVQVAPETADALAKLDQPDLAAQLSEWVGAVSPQGAVLRQWSNDLSERATVKFRAAAWSRTLSLSLRALDQSHDPKLPQPSEYSAWSEKDATRTLKPDQIAAVSASDGVIIFHVTGASLGNGDGIVFRNETAEAAEQQPNVIAGRADTGNFQRSAWFVFRAPPGRWKIESFSVARGYLVVNLCLGAPSFEVHAGDVIYAGSFDYASQKFAPDLSLDPVRQWLGSRWSERVKPAVYVNGDRGICAGTYIYNYEIEGAGYQPGYNWGGATAATR
jgi:hypothetical protein